MQRFLYVIAQAQFRGSVEARRIISSTIALTSQSHRRYEMNSMSSKRCFTSAGDLAQSSSHPSRLPAVVVHFPSNIEPLHAAAGTWSH